MAASHHLDRFLQAQNETYAQALAELQAGEKQSHWMWFMFPQIAGLGTSSTAQRYAIDSREEAAAYLQHEILGARLRELTRATLAHAGKSLSDIFGYPDDLKFCSSVTLFAEVAQPGDTLFAEAIRTFCKGPDERTLERLRKA